MSRKINLLKYSIGLININRFRIVICLGISWPLFLLSYRIFNRNYPEFDNYFFLFLREKFSSDFTLFFKLIYYCSGMYITALIIAAILGILIWKRYWQEAKVLAFSTLGVLILVDEILKPFFARRRPEGPRLVEVSGSKSFPSGHATGNLVLYFYLSYVISTRYPRLTIYVYGLATIFLILIGLSSVYVKAHWLTDILAGYGFGYLWLTICLTFLKKSKKN